MTKRLLVVALLAVSVMLVPCAAASWDGQYGTLSVFTMQFVPGAIPGIAGLYLPGAQPWIDIFVGTTDPSVNQLTVVIIYGAGEMTTVTVPVEDGGACANFQNVKVGDVTSITVIDNNGVVTQVL